MPLMMEKGVGIGSGVPDRKIRYDFAILHNIAI
jgi:hypothetical protein